MSKALVLLSPLLAALSACAQPLYRSEFLPLPPGPAKLADWDLRDAQYALQDGWLTVSSERSNPRALLKPTHAGDFTFRATVRGAGECHWSGLLARGVYRLEVNNQFVELALLRLVGDEWEKVARAPAYSRYLRNTGSFELRLVGRGSRISGFRLRLASADGAGRQVSLRFRLVDVWQQELQVKRQTVELPAGEEREVTVRFDSGRRGCFKVALDAGVTEADRQSVEDVGSFTVVSPALYNRPRIANSYFGGHLGGRLVHSGVDV
jgi:hypothetical protein